MKEKLKDGLASITSLLISGFLLDLLLQDKATLVGYVVIGSAFMVSTYSCVKGLYNYNTGLGIDQD